jgi:hypothetical protein
LTHQPNLEHLVWVTQSRTKLIPSEATLAPEVQAVLLELGAALDGQKPLQVHDHGIVAMVDEFSSTTQTKENGNERQSKRRPAARSRERSARRKGQTNGSRTSRTTSRFSGGNLHTAYEEQLMRLADAYPTLQTFPDKDGIWLLAGSEIVSNLSRGATFLVALPYLAGAGPKAWGYWNSNGSINWMGPRHTNFQDGSICAFSPGEGAWSEGGDLRTLFDLYCVWALRQLYLESFGRWPGKQYALSGEDVRMQAYYRLVECKDDELCGCGSENQKYTDCCKWSDQQFDLTQLMALFLKRVENGFASRRPPISITDYIEGRSSLPGIVDVHLQLRQMQSDPV